MSVRIAILSILVLLAQFAKGTHIIGGELYYDHLGGGDYLVTLELYRDCGPDNSLGTGFDFQVSIGVFDGNGNFLFTTSFLDPGETIVPVDLDNPCLGAPPSICIATTIYSGVVNLPPTPGGYHLSYQRCCRTPAIVNLEIPNEQGITCTVKVPGTPNAVNSAPRFTEYPPVVLCLGEDMVIDHSATDPDSDELVYELAAPYQGASNLDPAPAVPTAPPYTPVIWGPGYSAVDPMDGNPGIAIDAATGILTVTPTLIGSFAVGVRVRELRNGVQLSEVIRDFKFNVISCDLDIVAVIEESAPEEMFECLTASFTNGSMNAGFYHWDFGVQGTLADTSDLPNPVWTYVESGTYLVTLIANPGWPCSDTTQLEITTPPAFGAFFEPEEGLCMGQQYSFPALGDLPPGLNFQWTIPSGASATMLDGSVLDITFNTPGVHVIGLEVWTVECSETYTDSVSVYPMPVADFSSVSNVCLGEPVTFEDLSSAMTQLEFEWDLGDGNSSNDGSPVHYYNSPGTYTVVLTVTTTEGCVMQDTRVRVDQVIVYPLPKAGFRVMPSTVSMIDAEVNILDHAEGTVDWIYHIEDDLIYTPEFTYWFDDAGYVNVWQTVISEDGCRDSTSVEVFITDHLFFAPNSFTPNGDGLNDSFAPVVKGARHYEITIYDRYGTELFRSREPDAEWSGDGLPQGIYTYIVHIAEYGTHRQEYKGHVTLLR